jgi:hypothetical protein
VSVGVKVFVLIPVTCPLVKVTPVTAVNEVFELSAVLDGVTAL